MRNFNPDKYDWECECIYNCSAYQQGRADQMFEDAKREASITEHYRRLGIKDCLDWLYEGCFDARFDKLGASGGDVYSLLDKIYTKGFLDKIVEQIKEQTNE